MAQLEEKYMYKHIFIQLNVLSQCITSIGMNNFNGNFFQIIFRLCSCNLKFVKYHCLQDMFQCAIENTKSYIRYIHCVYVYFIAFYTFFKYVQNSIVYLFIFFILYFYSDLKFETQIIESYEWIKPIIQKCNVIFYSLVLKCKSKS